MTIPTMATRQQHEGKIEFHIERRPYFLGVAIRGEASFDDLANFRHPLLARRAMFRRQPLDYRRGLGRRGVEVRLASLHAPVWLALEAAGHTDVLFLRR